MLFRRSYILNVSLALGALCANAFTLPSRSFVKKTSLSVLPDSLDIPDFQPANGATASLESIASQAAPATLPSASAPLSISDITEKVPSIADPVSSAVTAVPPPPVPLPEPAVSLPAVSVPEITPPAVSVPDVSALSSGFPTELLPIGLGVIAIAAIGAFVLGGSKDESDSAVPAPTPSPAAVTAPTPAPVSATEPDLSIPYDAAARLAYGNGPESGFADFKKKYEEDTVKMVIEKKKARGTGY